MSTKKGGKKKKEQEDEETVEEAEIDGDDSSANDDDEISDRKRIESLKQNYAELKKEADKLTKEKFINIISNNYVMVTNLNELALLPKKLTRLMYSAKYNDGDVVYSYGGYLLDVTKKYVKLCNITGDIASRFRKSRVYREFCIRHDCTSKLFPNKTGQITWFRRVERGDVGELVKTLKDESKAKDLIIKELKGKLTKKINELDRLKKLIETINDKK